MSTACCRRRPAAPRLRRPIALLGILGLAALACATMTVSDERAMGQDAVRQVRSEVREIRDPVVRQYVGDIGDQILAAMGPQPFEYRFYVVDDESINAFAIPGGHIFVHTGVILKARNVSELAGVIGHEIGHVALRHIARNYNKYKAGQLGHQAAVLAGGVFGGQAGATAADLAGGLAIMSILNSFGREAEREADDFAVDTLPRAGYDPHGLPTFFETLIREGGSRPPEFLSSHPATENRLEDTRTAINQLDLPPTLLVNDGGKLEIIQRRIRLLTGDEAPQRP